MVRIGTATTRMNVSDVRVVRKSDDPTSRFARTNMMPANSRKSPRKMNPVMAWK